MGRGGRQRDFPAEGEGVDDVDTAAEESPGLGGPAVASRGVSLRILDPGGVVTTMSVGADDRPLRYRINHIDPDG